jgi:hypothetical protein
MTDFAVVISILIWSLVGNAFPEIPIEKLNVPSKFAPTFQCCDTSCTTSWPNECYGQEAPSGYRPWVVNLSDLNGKTWVPFMAAGPALLAFILVFLDDGITWHLINHPSHKLKHGDAYNVSNFLSALWYHVFGPLIYTSHLWNCFLVGYNRCWCVCFGELTTWPSLACCSYGSFIKSYSCDG